MLAMDRGQINGQRPPTVSKTSPMPYDAPPMRNNLTTMQYPYSRAVEVSRPVNLKDIPLFKGLREDDLRALAGKAVTKSVLKNVIVFTEGELTRSLYVILSGRVKMYLNDENGRELVLDVKGPGEYFGETMLDEGPRPASAAAMESCQFAIVSGADFKKLLIEHPDIAISVIQNLIQATRGLTENVRSLAMDVYGRVSKMLLALAVEQRGNFVIPEKLTQQEIASRVGTSREVINRILRDLSIGGYIGVKEGTITINKPLPSRWQMILRASPFPRQRRPASVRFKGRKSADGERGGFINEDRSGQNG
jgi:CRP/FNR family cyclic AMP-dependent transcriptional regulator